MAILKNILQEITISTKPGADYSDIQNALIDPIKTMRIEEPIILTSSIVFPAGITIIIGTNAKISGNFTLTGNDTVLILEGNGCVFGTEVLFAGTWISHNVNPEWFGAIGDGITNDHAAFASAIAFCNVTHSKTLVLNTKTYLVNGILSPGDLTLHGNHAKIIADTKTLFNVQGTHTNYVFLSKDAYKGDSWIMCNDNSFLLSLSQGDIIKIMSDEICQPESGENVRFGEMHEIRSVDVDNNIIYFNEYLNWKYLISDNARVCKTQMIKLVIKDLQIWLNGEDTESRTAIRINYAKPFIENVKIKAYSYACLFDNCWKPVFRGQTFQTDQSGYGYGVCTAGATMYADISGAFIGTRHGFTAGGSGSNFGPTFGGISWYTNVHDSIATSARLDNANFDTHASTGSVTFNNCISIGGTFRDYGLSIDDWDENITYEVDTLIRSITGKIYKCILESIGNDPDISPEYWKPVPANNQCGFKAEGLYTDIIDCVVIGCNFAVRAVGKDMESVFINGLKAYECYYGVYQTLASKIQELFVNNLTIINKHLFDGLALYIPGNISNWSFSNFNLTGVRIIRKSFNTIKPSKLILNNIKASVRYPQNIDAIYISDRSINTIILKDIDVENMNLFSMPYLSSEQPLSLFEINGVTVKGTLGDIIYVDHPVENLLINGLQVYDNADNTKHLINIRVGVNRLSLNNISYIGVNAINGIYTHDSATLNYILHNNNLMPNLATFRSGTNALTAIEIVGGSVGSPVVIRGVGNPENNVVANIGTLYLRSDDNTESTLYVKESGVGNTGWVAK